MVSWCDGGPGHLNVCGGGGTGGGPQLAPFVVGRGGRTGGPGVDEGTSFSSGCCDVVASVPASTSLFDVMLAICSSLGINQSSVRFSV